MQRAALVIAAMAVAGAVIAILTLPFHVHRIAPIGLRSATPARTGEVHSVHFVHDRGAGWSPSTDVVPFSYYEPPRRMASGS